MERFTPKRHVERFTPKRHVESFTPKRPVECFTPSLKSVATKNIAQRLDKTFQNKPFSEATYHEHQHKFTRGVSLGNTITDDADGQ